MRRHHGNHRFRSTRAHAETHKPTAMIFSARQTPNREDSETRRERSRGNCAPIRMVADDQNECNERADTVTGFVLAENRHPNVDRRRRPRRNRASHSNRRTNPLAVPAPKRPTGLLEQTT